MSNEELKSQAQKLLQACDAIFLATTDAGGTPMASYAPCWRDKNGYLFVMLSDLAEHTANLRSNPTASCLVLGRNSENSFSRPRITLQMDVQFLTPEHISYSQAIDGLTAKHGETMEILKELSDFNLIRLKPVSGTLVGGFATTLKIDPDSTPGLIPS